MSSALPTFRQLFLISKLLFYFFYLICQHVWRKAIKFARPSQVPAGKLRVCSILWRFKLDPEEISRWEDFVYSDGAVGESSFLEKDPHWYPYTITMDLVYFVRLPKPFYEYNVKKYPFMFVPMFEEALEVVEMSHDEFHRMFDRLGSHDENIPETILFTNTARCGSTLLATMLDNKNESICLGEPHILSMLAVWLKNKQFFDISEEDFKRVSLSVLTALRANTPKGIKLVLKTTSGEACLVPYLKPATKLKNIFMFRKNALMSCEKMVRREAFLYRILLRIYLINSRLSGFLGYLVWIEGELSRILCPVTLRAWAAIVYASPFSSYLKHKSCYDHPILWYEDVLKNSVDTITQLFQTLDIPQSCVESATSCLNNDSQKNSFLSSDQLKHVQLRPLSDFDKAMLRYYANVMSVPTETFYS